MYFQSRSTQMRSKTHKSNIFGGKILADAHFVRASKNAQRTYQTPNMWFLDLWYNASKRSLKDDNFFQMEGKRYDGRYFKYPILSLLLFFKLKVLISHCEKACIVFIYNFTLQFSLIKEFIGVLKNRDVV